MQRVLKKSRAICLVASVLVLTYAPFTWGQIGELSVSDLLPLLGHVAHKIPLDLEGSRTVQVRVDIYHNLSPVDYQEIDWNKRQHPVSVTSGPVRLFPQPGEESFFSIILKDLENANNKGIVDLTWRLETLDKNGVTRSSTLLSETVHVPELKEKSVSWYSSWPSEGYRIVRDKPFALWTTYGTIADNQAVPQPTEGSSLEDGIAAQMYDYIVSVKLLVKD